MKLPGASYSQQAGEDHPFERPGSCGCVAGPMIARVHAPKPDPFAFKNALRAAIVMPLAFALSLVVIDDRQMALFAAFGSVALLVFVDFSGSPRARLYAYLALVAVGALLITVGTLCSHTTWLATAVMGLVAFAILFGGVLNDYVAAARAGAMLTFVLPVMVPADAATIPMRLAGWGLAAALCIPATLLLWPMRARSAVRHGAAQAARAVAELVDARRRGDPSDPSTDAVAQTAHAAVVAVRDRFVSVALRPSGTAGPTAALARLIEDLGWLQRVAVRVPSLPSGGGPCPLERNEIEVAAAATLRDVASRLDGSPSNTVVDLERLRAADGVFGHAQLAHFRALRPDRDEAEATAELDEAYRLRQLAFATLQAGSGRPAGVWRPRRRRAGRNASSTTPRRSPARSNPREPELGMAAQQPARSRRTRTGGSGRAADRPAARFLDRARDAVGAAIQRPLDEHHNRFGIARDAGGHRRRRVDRGRSR